MKGTQYVDLKTYHGWKSVPKSLKTRTALKREGLFVPHGVKAVAQVVTRSAFGREGGCYLLYRRSQCRALAKLEEKQSLEFQLRMKLQDAKEHVQTERVAVLEEILQEFF